MYCPSGHCLCRTLQTQSAQVWNDLHDADMLGTPYHEETVTQSLALHLNRQHPAENRVHIFGRKAESKNGSDFIWLFFRRDLSRYLPVAVQAKRLYADGRYAAFKADQVRDIRLYAQSFRGLPIYLFYNHPRVALDLLSVWSEHCPDMLYRILHCQRDLGMLFVNASEVTGIRDGQLTPADIALGSKPMWVPFCQCRATRTGDPLDELAEQLRTSSTKVETRERYGPRDTPSVLLAWMQGEQAIDADLMAALQPGDELSELGFSPSFVLGTSAWGPRDVGAADD